MKTSDQSIAWGARSAHVASKNCRDGLSRRSGAETDRLRFLASRQKHIPGLRLILFSLLIVLITISASAQIQQAWVAKYNNGITKGTNQAVKMALDSNGNICITGFSQNTNTNLGYVTIKYAPNGNQIWAARYDSTNNFSAMPTAMALDTSNNIIVTGSALTMKYDSNGNQLWTAPYAGAALAVDANGNVAVTGFDSIFSTVKINAAGTNLWSQSYPASCGAAEGQAIVADTNGNFYVAGNYPFSCERGLSDYELLLIKYASNGNQTWTTTYSSGGGPPWQTESALIRRGNLYLAGNFVGRGVSEGYVVFEYDDSGNLLWSAFPSNDDYSRDYESALDQMGYVLMTGQIATSFINGLFPVFSYATMKLATNGSTLWTSFYPTTAVVTNVANAIAVDQNNNSYVTGYSPGTNSGNDIVTIKYDPNGNQIWLQRYTSPANGNAAGNAIAVDKNGNVYVTGYETTAAGGTEIVTIKYSPVTVQRRSDGTVLLQAQGSPGESFDIQASADLQSWLDLGIFTADTNGLLQFDDTNAPNYPSRFYFTNPQ
jgi:hypothetical protein